MTLALAIGAGLLLVAAAALVRWRQPVFAATSRVAHYLGEVRAEVRKVTWPSWNELRKSTVVILIFVIIIGIVISLMDFVFSLLLVSLPGRLFA
ncbi:MAG: preprotein translocase subunit SecE [Gemmatimonadetes bacterium]|nr:preprotein translocase subunit SecE [Gemmatimonadota bacterium]MBI2402362.1 preprotein translocase subunit SecE [Gemmatimonadota bacterium]MBI2535401.1 preprotein translocase subunit SecE [Gemmatimonadota bacterium]